MQEPLAQLNQEIIPAPPRNKIGIKVAVGTFAGAVTILLISFVTRMGVEITPTEAGALTIIVAKVFEYYARD